MTDQRQEYRFESLPIDEDADLAPVARWIESEWSGFSRDAPSAPAVTAEIEDFRADDRRVVGVYATQPVSETLDESHPVGTLSSFTKTITVADGSLVRAHLLASVTVAPAHRRQGILRRLITDSLAFARGHGCAVAALTATQAGIYRRFGFGIATRRRLVTVDSGHGFPTETPRVGTVGFVGWERLSDIAPSVFARHHIRTLGSIDRSREFWRKLLGPRPSGEGPDRSLRAAVHFSPSGDIDGFVTYRIKRIEASRRLQIVDLIAENDGARIELWHAMAALDMVDHVEDDFSPPDDALAMAAVDPRSVHIRGEQDHVWLRILDPVSALDARRLEIPSDVTLRIRDDLGFASGSYRLTPSPSGAVAEELADGGSVDLEMDVSTLSSLYIGGVSVTSLAGIGLIRENAPGALARADLAFRAASTLQSRAVF